MYLCMYVCMDVWMYGCMYVCMYVCMCVCVYMYICVCIYIYIYTHGYAEVMEMFRACAACYAALLASRTSAVASEMLVR